MSIDNFRGAEQGKELLENCVTFQNAHSKYLDYEKGVISYDELNDWIKSDEGFSLQDKESFNCHSFLLSVMKNDLNKSSVDTFEDVYMDADNWRDEDGYMDGELRQMYNEHVTEEFPLDSEERMKKLRVFQENVLENSKKFVLNDLKDELATISEEILKDIVDVDDQGSMSDREYGELCDNVNEKNRKFYKKNSVIKDKKIKEYSRMILKEITDNNLSRFAFLFDEGENAQPSHSDTHSFIILGENENKDDVVILEKEGPGEAIRLIELSELIEDRLDQELTLSIPTKKVTELYPD